MSQYGEYQRKADTSVGPSPAIWADFDPIQDGKYGLYYNDFNSFGGVVTTKVGTYGGGLISYEETSSSIKQIATEKNGVVRILLNAAANNDAYLTTGYNNGGMCSISATTPKKFWFEARIMANQTTDQGLFVGMAEEGLAASQTLVNTSTALKTTADFIGFRVIIGTPAALDAVYQKASQTLQTVKAAAQTLVAATWYKLGMKFDGTALRYFINSSQVGSDVTTISATTFPNGEELAFLAGLATVTGAANSLDMDFVKIGWEK